MQRKLYNLLAFCISFLIVTIPVLSQRSWGENINIQTIYNIQQQNIQRNSGQGTDFGTQWHDNSDTLQQNIQRNSGQGTDFGTQWHDNSDTLQQNIQRNSGQGTDFGTQWRNNSDILQQNIQRNSGQGTDFGTQWRNNSDILQQNIQRNSGQGTDFGTQWRDNSDILQQNIQLTGTQLPINNLRQNFQINQSQFIKFQENFEQKIQYTINEFSNNGIPNTSIIKFQEDFQKKVQQIINQSNNNIISAEQITKLRQDSQQEIQQIINRINKREISNAQLIQYNQGLQNINQVIQSQIILSYTYNDIPQAQQYTIEGQSSKAIDSWKKVLNDAQKNNDPITEVLSLNAIGANIELKKTNNSEYKKYLEKQIFYNIAFTDCVNNYFAIRSEKFNKLNIESINEESNKNSKNNVLNSSTLLGQKTENNRYETNELTEKDAFKYYNAALDRLKKIGDRDGEAVTQNYIALAYQKANKTPQSIETLEKTAEYVLEVRKELTRQCRKEFLQINQGVFSSLISQLIDQKNFDKAYNWANRATTSELVDYRRLINANVSDIEAQKAINAWNKKYQELETLQNNLKSDYSTDSIKKIAFQQDEINKEAENLSRQHSEIAELLETNSQDIAKLKANLPLKTLVIHPMLLDGMPELLNKAAIFTISKQQPINAIKIDINSPDLVEQHRSHLESRGNSNYYQTGISLYDIFIRPLESQIKFVAPTNISIIATGKLRYIPFETFYDKTTDEYLIQKYSINYLTRLSVHSLEQNAKSSYFSLQKGVLALANPDSDESRNIKASEDEVTWIGENIPKSKIYIRQQATLETFQTQAYLFPFLHLATHGCFQSNGCPALNMRANTILFANNQQMEITEATKLGLKNADMLILSACQTALEAQSNGVELPGLAYLFELAGAKTVMGSLWNISDPATKEVVTQFYKNLRLDMNKSEALRLAKLKVLEMKDKEQNISYSHPYFWSPLILIGDPR